MAFEKSGVTPTEFESFADELETDDERGTIDSDDDRTPITSPRGWNGRSTNRGTWQRA